MKKQLILLVVSFAMLLEAIDTTILNTAIPSMAQSLKVNPLDLKLALISYLLSLSLFIPISGWLADKFGLKKVFIFALGLFTISSIACGFTQNLWQLIIARFLQGMGGSLTMPVGRLIILRIFARHELIAKMSIVIMVASLGMMLGPVLGGILTTHFSWPWIFWVNVPIGILGMVLAYILFPPMPAVPVSSLDKTGFILFGLGLATLTYSLSAFSESFVSQRQTWWVFSGSLLLLLLYGWHSKNKSHPIVKISLLTKRTFRISVLGNLCTRLSFGGLPFLLPLLLQMGLHFTPQLSGLLLAPTALGVLVIKPISLRILRFLGYKKLLIINTIMVSISLYLFTLITPLTSIYIIGFLAFLYGFFMALQYTGMNSLAYANIAEEDLSAATSIMSTLQQCAQSFGVAFAAILVSAFTYNFSNHSPNIIETLHHCFAAMALFTLVSLLIFIQLKAEDGKELIESPTK